MSRKILFPRPEVEKRFVTSSPSALCEALGFCSLPVWAFGFALFRLHSWIFMISSDDADGFLKLGKRGG
jgi:hypothetical protein